MKALAASGTESLREQKRRSESKVFQASILALMWLLNLISLAKLIEITFPRCRTQSAMSLRRRLSWRRSVGLASHSFQQKSLEMAIVLLIFRHLCLRGRLPKNFCEKFLYMQFGPGGVYLERCCGYSPKYWEPALIAIEFLIRSTHFPTVWIDRRSWNIFGLGGTSCWLWKDGFGLDSRRGTCLRLKSDFLPVPILHHEDRPNVLRLRRSRSVCSSTCDIPF